MMMVLSIIAPPAWAQGASTQVLGQHRAIISQTQGTVEVRAAGRSTWTTAARNMEVKTGDRIRTGPSSKCKVRISDVGEVEITSSSEAAVGNLQQVQTTARAFFMFQRTITRDDVGLDLRSGDMRSSFRRVEGRVGNYNVHTPVAVAGVRGTKFELDLEGGRPWYERLEGYDDGKGQGAELGLTTIVLEGEVEVVGPNWSRSVTGGQQLFAQSGQVPGQPGGADPNRLDGISDAFQPAGDEQPPVFSGATSMTRPASGELLVNWTAASDNVTAAAAILYDIFVATEKSKQDYATPTATSEAGALSITLTGTDDAQDYFVVVRARDAAGNRDLNAKEVTTSAVADVTAPTFDGAIAATKTAPTTAVVRWEPATDDRSAAEKIVYDVYLATSQSGQNFSAPTATSAPGATTFTLVNQPAGLDFYIVVRARDEAGNRDENIREARAFAYDAACARTAEELFIAYEQENEGQFMAAIAPNFAGVNNSGVALDAATLLNSVKNDFSVLQSAAFSVTINSVSRISENKYQVEATWSGRLRFESGADTDRIGMTTKMIMEGEQLPLQVVQWEGASPFGMSDPLSGVTLVPTGSTDETILAISGTTQTEISSSTTGDLTGVIVPAEAPVISSITGMPTTFDIQGNYRDFGPFRVVVTGTGFQSGAAVYAKPDFDPGYENFGAKNDLDFQTSLFFVSSTELWVDVAKLIMQYIPNRPTQENISFYVQNPDGQNSAVYSILTDLIPGPLNMVTGALTTDRQVMTDPSASPYQFTLGGYNLVTPVSVIISTNAATPASGVTISNVNVYGSPIDGDPLTLAFTAQVGGGGLPSGTAYVLVQDGHVPSQAATEPFAVNTSTDVTWTSDPKLTQDYEVPAGHSLTINSGVTVTGSGYRILVDGTLNASGATLDGVGVEYRTGSSGTLNGVTIRKVSSAGLTVNDGNVIMSGGRVTGCGTGISLSAGSLALSNLTVDYNSGAGGIYGVGISMTGGTFPTFSNVISRNNRIGLSVNGAVNPTVSGGSFSSNTAHGILVDGGASLTVQTGTQVNGNVEGLLVSQAGTVNVSGASFSANSSNGIKMDNAATGATVRLTSVSISGSPWGVESDAGSLQLQGGNTIVGGSSGAGIELRSSAALSTSGTSNRIEGPVQGSGTALKCAASSVGSVTIGNSTAIKNAEFGILANGGGTITIDGASTVIESCKDGINIEGSSNVTIGTGVTIQNNIGGHGVLVGNAGTVTITGANIIGNTDYGVARTSGITLNGGVYLDNVRLNSNKNQFGISDMNTTVTNTDGNSDQFFYLINTRNEVKNPRN